MKPFVVTYSILLGVVYALPFQTPVQGSYQCFSSEESPFAANAQNTGATLTINADGSYTFTTSDASENGSAQATEDTTADLEQVFQNGSSLSLQPSSGSPAYEGMFATDKQGGMYIFINTNNNLTLRCQSPGADIASVFDSAAGEQVATEAQPTPETQTTAASGSYDEALVTVWGNGKLAVMTKEWCDVKVPDLQTSNAQALETWQAEQSFYEIEEKLKVYAGTAFSTLEENLAATREGLFAQFDANISDPASYCQNLLTELRNHHNLRENFPNEYAVIERGDVTAETGNEIPTGETITVPDVGELVAGGRLEPGDYNCVTESYWAEDNTTTTRRYLRGVHSKRRSSIVFRYCELSKPTPVLILTHSTQHFASK